MPATQSTLAGAKRKAEQQPGKLIAQHIHALQQWEQRKEARLQAIKPEPQPEQPEQQQPEQQQQEEQQQGDERPYSPVREDIEQQMDYSNAPEVARVAAELAEEVMQDFGIAPPVLQPIRWQDVEAIEEKAQVPDNRATLCEEYVQLEEQREAASKQSEKTAEIVADEYYMLRTYIKDYGKDLEKLHELQVQMDSLNLHNNIDGEAVQESARDLKRRNRMSIDAIPAILDILDAVRTSFRQMPSADFYNMKRKDKY